MPPNDHGQHPSSGEALLALALDLAPFLREDAGEVGKAAIDADRQAAAAVDGIADDGVREGFGLAALKHDDLGIRSDHDGVSPVGVEAASVIGSGSFHG
jgi:hypothetical protein